MGLFYSLLSAVFSTSKDLLSKRLAFRLDGATSTFASFAFALPFYVLFLAVRYLQGAETFEITWDFLVLVLLRSLTDTLAEGMKMYALACGDVSIVTLFSSLTPLILLVVSPLLTGDAVSLEGVVAVTVVVAGSLVLVYRRRPRDEPPQGRAVLLSAGAAVFFALNSCFDRLAVQRSTPVFSGFAMTLLSAVFLVPFIVLRADRRGALWVYRGGLLSRGALEVAFMVSKLYALQFLSAPYVAGLQRLSLVLSVIGGRVFFREPDFVRRLAAGLLILAGVFLIARMGPEDAAAPPPAPAVSRETLAP